VSRSRIITGSWMRTSVEYSDAARSSVGAASAALDMPRRKLRRWCRVG
jgi:hypothetical protein